MNNTIESATTFSTNPFTRCFNGLDKLFKHNQTMALVLLAISLFSGLLQFIGNFMPESSGPSEPAVVPVTPEPTNIALMLAIIIPIILILFAGIVIITTYLSGMVHYVAWKTSRGETATFMESLRVVTKRFWTLLAISVIVGLKTFFGYLLLIVPGVRANLRYRMVYMPVFDENLRASDAIKRIKQLTKGHLLEEFGVVTVATIVPIIGLLLTMGGHAVFYPQLKSAVDSGASYPKIHWLNSLGILLITLLLLFIGLIVFLAIFYLPE